MKKIFFASALSLVCVLGMSLNAQAQSLITWQSGVTLTGDADINTTGTTAVAYNATTTSGDPLVGLNQTVNGVTFIGTGLPTTLTGPGAFLFLTTSNANPTSRNNQGAFGSAGFGPGGIGDLTSGGSFNLTTAEIGGLTIGDDYLIQTIVHDGRGTRADAQTAYSNGQATGVDLSSVAELDEGGVGSYVIGTFTASAETQSFEIYGEANTADAGGTNFALNQSASAINAIQVRNVSTAVVPEPSSLALLGIAGLGMVTRRRRK